MTLIKTENLSLSYDGIEVIKNLNIEIHDGDYICVIGENGSGKSTLIKGLLQLINTTSGKIIYGDNLINNKIGYLPQQTNVQKDFPASVKEIVMSGFQNKVRFFPFYTLEQRKRSEEIFELLGISSIKNKCYNELSGGQQQRILLARALCATNNILILDEPIAGLDPVITAEFYDIIDTLNKQTNTTIIMVTHDLSVVEKYANKVLHLFDNSFIFDTKENYKTSEFGSKYLGGGKNDID